MPNLFDEIVEEEHKHPAVHDASAPPVQKKAKAAEPEEKVTLTFTKHRMERGIYLGIIVALALYAFVFQPLYLKGELSSGEALTGHAIADAAEQKIVEETTPDTADVQQPEPTVIIEAVPNTTLPSLDPQSPPEETIGSFDRDFVFSVTNIDVFRNSGKPMLVKSISFVMKNDWKTFKPLVEVRWYDDASSEAARTKIRTRWIGPTFKKDSSLTVVLEDSNDFEFGKGLEQGEGKETFVFEIYDRETLTLLDTYTTTVS